MLIADLSIARAYLQHNPPPGEVLVCAITGAHLYGFPSPDSDLDLKGIHLLSFEAMLGLNPQTALHDRTEIFRDVECDLTTNEAAESLRLLLSGNGNMLERILSPLQVVESPDLEELRALAIGSLSRKFARHYSGFLKGMRREIGNDPTVKGILYAYRVALTGIHLLRTGEVEPNVTVLAPLYRLAAIVNELVELKQHGEEHAKVSPEFATSHDENLTQLAGQIVDVETTSPLPLEPRNLREINDWLVNRRMRTHPAQ
jgi:uncharacterized protein